MCSNNSPIHSSILRRHGNWMFYTSSQAHGLVIHNNKEFCHLKKKPLGSRASFTLSALCFNIEYNFVKSQSINVVTDKIVPDLPCPVVL